VTVPGPGAGKEDWRHWARRTRGEVDYSAIGADVLGGLESWGGIGRGEAVLVYDALPDEVDVSGVSGAVRMLITRTNEDGLLTIHDHSEPRERHAVGYTQPVAGSPAVDPWDVDVALVPGLAFDGTGTRLGRGRGYYDRLLAGLRPGAVIVGVSPDALVVPNLPSADHDVPMSHLATESGVIAVGEEQRSLLVAALDWIDGDPDPQMRLELAEIIESGDRRLLAERMGATLQFGTAGIRGVVEAGSNRMNRAVVIRTSKGLADHLLDRGGEGPVVIGYDGRLSSRQFAEDAAGVLGAAGLPVMRFTEVAATPLVAFTAAQLGARAAVVVTASHNPPRDNGYKVYDANSAQIVPPVDTEIAAAIAAVGPATGVPSDGSGTATIGAEAADRYLQAVLEFRGDTPSGGSPRIAYTPLHGVGGSLALRALAEAGHGDVTAVTDQFEPDGRFPTVDFPNPEEPGAMDLVEALGSEIGAGLVLANDPDADRLAVAVPAPEGWRRLTGNEIGMLLADYVLSRTSGDDRLVINSIVSSPMLADIAAAHGASFTQTLTGFKWIANAALDLELAGAAFVFGYEEALGYTVGPVVRDKDGISAAVWFADLAAACAVEGIGLGERLQTLYEAHGKWAGAQQSVVRPGAAGAQEIAAAMALLTEHTPEVVGGLDVVGVTDFRRGAEDRPRWLAATPLVAFDLEGGSRVLVRPSGTEPKLKMYAYVRVEPDTPDADARGRAEAAAADLAGFLGL